MWQSGKKTRRFSKINISLASCAWCVWCLAFYISTSESSAQKTDVFGILNVPQIQDESLYTSSADFAIEKSTSRVSAMKKISLIRYYLGPKIPGTRIAIVVDTAETFYENVKRLWKLVMTGEKIDADILLFVYNDTDCSFLTTLTTGNDTLPEALDSVSPSTPIFSDAETILKCLNLALKTMQTSDSSIMLFTGRKAGDGVALDEITAIEMTKKRNEFNCVWCANDTGELEEFWNYKKIARNTNGHFLQFTKLDYDEIVASGVDPYNRGYKTANYTKSNNDFSSDIIHRTLPTMEISRDSESTIAVKNYGRGDESADLLYDPKISSSFENVGKIVRANTARIVTVPENDDEGDKKEALELEDMELASLTAIESAIRLETTAIEVSSETSLVGRPGSVSRLTFRVTNNYPLTIRHYFQARSTSFDVVYLEPRNVWIESGKSVNVVADVLVPTTATDSTTGTVTLITQSIGSIEKSSYIYVRASGSTISDSSSPSINYGLNNNCAGKLGSDTCANNLWSVDITIQDTGSGVQRVSSSPKGIQAKTTFVSGTKSATTFQYAATCCQSSVVITAEDLFGNSKSETIDVTVWYNLSGGEIAAIVLGSLLLLILLVIIILAIIFCILRRRKSQDLPYTQRYGSRPPVARAERTSF